MFPAKVQKNPHVIVCVKYYFDIAAILLIQKTNMKKITITMALLFAVTIFVSAQNNEYLKRWTEEGNKNTTTQTDKEKNEKKKVTPLKDMYVGIGVGYAAEGYIPFDFHLLYKKMYYGLSASLPVSKGTKGERYTTLNWDEFPEDHIEDGEYYLPITFDIGYNISSFTIGAGAGLAFGSKYRNCYDASHILGDNGYYYKDFSGQTVGEFKAFAKYRFPSKSVIHCYLSAQYTIRTGVGAIFGFEL